MAGLVTISQEELDEMKDELTFLEALRAAGVDNWDGYDYAQELYKEMKE